MSKRIQSIYIISFLVALSILSCDISDEEGKDTGQDKDNTGNIVNPKCDSNADTCLSTNEVVHCVNGKRIREYCKAGEYCYDGKCGKIVCVANEIESCNENGTYHGCNPAGTEIGDYPCPDNQTCVDNQCKLRWCEAGTGNCLDSETILLCNEAGTAFSDAKKCTDILEKSVCENGKCISICDQSNKNASYIGCEYWAVDLDNAIDAGVYDAAGQPFAVVLSNTHDQYSANVEIYAKSDNSIKRTFTFEVPSGEVRTVYLPSSDCYEGTSCTRAYSVNNTTITDTAYYIKSDVPITAAQFNPLDNYQVYSNDASLLFPTTALGLSYMIMARQQFHDNFHAFVTIVATQPGKTKVEVKASCKFMRGLDKNKRDISAMNRGDIQTFYLDQFDTLNLETSEVDEDPTGTLVTADNLIAVFAGVEATSLPETEPVTCCADHIEHQQYPMNAWGKQYNAVKLKPRNKERDLWRIMARVDGTVVRTVPNVFNRDDSEITLNAGQWFDVLTRDSFSISATEPILVGQFMVSQNDPNDIETGVAGPDSAGTGDPSYIIGVPVEQYRTTYQFLAPSKYEYDYITIIAPHDATVALDGERIPDDEFFTFGDGSYRAAYRRVEDGAHSIRSDKRIGLFSYGYDQYVSYGYAAGLDLKDLWE